MSVKYAKLALKEAAKDLLRNSGLRIGDYERLTTALFTERAHRHLGERIKFLMHLPPECAAKLLPYLPYTHSQAGQELFVLSQIGPKQGGYFVEFGATDGLNISNSYFFESRLGWNGIVAEPARMWHRDLVRNRRCNIEKRCVWSATGAELQFLDVAELSTIAGFEASDFHAKDRLKNESYLVKTISLNDLLAVHEAPKHIDYLSIDTEGTEFAILNAFDFGKHSFGVITCEHNRTPQREDIYRLLTANGYKRIMEEASDVDDWYVLVDSHLSSV
jgi:FkbM family methyltransferase